MGYPGKRNPKNLRHGRVEGPVAPRRTTLMRAALIDRIVAEWDRRDEVERMGGTFESFLASLSKREFLETVWKVLPRQQNITLDNGGEALNKLLQVAKREQPAGGD
jgi:hypothetical protein